MASRAARIAVSTAWGWVTSILAPRIPSRRASAASFTSQTVTAAPSAASRRAVASPMPEAPPVTRALRPVKRVWSMRILRWWGQSGRGRRKARAQPCSAATVLSTEKP